MAEAKKKRQKRSVYLVIEHPKEFETKKQCEEYLARTGMKDGLVVYQAKPVPFNVVKVIHIG